MTRLRLTDHFTVEEFDCHDGTRVPPRAVPALLSLCHHILEPMRAQFGPCAVTSGYRERTYNRRIGSTDGSFHVYDLRIGEGAAVLSGGACAADVTFKRGGVEAWARSAETIRVASPTLRSRALGGVGRYPSSGFVHVDTGPRRNWNG